MSDTSPGAGFGADPNEAAFQRLEQGLAALRRDTAPLRQSVPGDPAPLHDPRALEAALAEVNHRIDALTSRPGALGDYSPILAMLSVVEAKISSLTGRLDRVADQSTLTEAMAAANAKIDALAARIDARLTQLEDRHTLLAAQPVPVAMTMPASALPVSRPAQPAPADAKPPEAAFLPSPAPQPTHATTRPLARPAISSPVPQSAFATMSKGQPEVRRSHVPALLVLVVMVLSAAAALVWVRPDLIKSDWIRQEWLDPAREKASRWLHLSRVTTQTVPTAAMMPGFAQTASIIPPTTPKP